jgi:hypothetical protein
MTEAMTSYNRIEEIDKELATNESLTFAEVDALEDEKKLLLEQCERYNRLARR